MASSAIQKSVEQLAETLVFTDPADLPALAQLHTLFCDVGAWAKEEQRLKTMDAAHHAADLIEKIILQEAPDVPGAMVILNQTAAVFQQIIAQDCPENEVVFPEAAGEGAGGNAASAEGVGAFSVKLPPNVDETIFTEFLARQDGVLEEMEALILSLENAENPDDIGALKRSLHTLKGESALLGLNDIERLCHAAEDHLSDGLPERFTDVLLSLKDWLKRAFDAYSGKGTPPEGVEGILTQLTSGFAPAKAAAGAAEARVRVEEPEEAVYTAKALDGDKDLLGDFVQEANEHLENSDLHLLTLETDPENADAVNAVFRAFHTIKGVAGFLALDEIQALAHDAENLLDHARKGVLRLVGPNIDVVFDAVDMLKQCVEHVRNALASGGLLQPVPGVSALVTRIKRAVAGELRPEDLASAPAEGALETPRLGTIMVESCMATESAVRDALAAQQVMPPPKKVGEILRAANVTSAKTVSAALEIQQSDAPDMKVGQILVEMGAVAPEDVEQALNAQQAPLRPPRVGETLVQSGESDVRDVVQALRAQRAQGQAPAAAVQVHEAVKVDALRLDQLVDMIGELVIAESMVAQSSELRGILSTDIARHISQLDKITRELQVMAMSLRMVPVRSTFQKMARLVRDLAKKTDKAVEFHMSGEDTELDKTVVDRIGDPLVHMVRNSVDHGIEDSAEERAGAGKPATGNIYLRAFHAGGNIHIQIEDDGKGLNREAILKKAVERGLIRPEDTLSDRDTWNLIFEPGFSTAQKLTAVSGRGVGMDVVKRNIEALRGQVDIQSEQGKGTVFTIRLPLTLAIIDGMVIRVGKERYVLPTLSIVISLRPGEKDVTTVVRQGEMLSLHGRLIPLFRLHRMFNIGSAVQDYREGTVVVVENNGQQVGLLIDEILGQQQIVIKSLGEALKGLPGIAGGAIMPDGLVGLILDIGGLVKLATEEIGAA